MTYIWKVTNQVAERTKRNRINLFLVTNTLIWSLLGLLVCAICSFSTVGIEIFLLSCSISLFGGVIFTLRQE